MPAPLPKLPSLLPAQAYQRDHAVWQGVKEMPDDTPSLMVVMGLKNIRLAHPDVMNALGWEAMRRSLMNGMDNGERECLLQFAVRSFKPQTEPHEMAQRLSSLIGRLKESGGELDLAKDHKPNVRVAYKPRRAFNLVGTARRLVNTYGLGYIERANKTAAKPA